MAFNIQRDLAIYKSEAYSEWQKVIAKLKTDNDNYLVKFHVALESGGQPRIKMTPIVQGLTDIGKTVSVISFTTLYYATELLQFMISHPTITGKGLQEGREVTIRVPKKSIDETMERISPEVHMKRVLKQITSECLNDRRGKKGRLRTNLLLHVLYGLNLNLTTPNHIVSSTVLNIQSTDFGFRDVRHAEALLALVIYTKSSERALLPPHTIINRIDDLLAEHGRPVVRPLPTSLSLREILTKVKTSQLFIKEPVQLPAQLPETIPF